MSFKIKNIKNVTLKNWVSVLVGISLGSSVAFSGANAQPIQTPKELRIGYQKYGTLILLKAKGSLDKRLAEKGVTVKWTEFAFGPPLLEAINVNSIDVGSTGESPPIFAQAAGADIVYIGNEPPAPKGEGLIVLKDSPIKKVADLKGKKVAVAKGSNANYLLVKVLENAGLKYTDIDVVYLTPADARSAFETKAIDAWAIWDPFYSAAEKQLSARLLADGTNAVSNYQFYLSSGSYANKYPEIINILLDEINKVDQWGKRNTDEVAKFIAPLIGIELPTVELAAQRLSYGVKPLTPTVLESQQKIADKFFELKLVPKLVQVKDIAWTPPIKK